MVLIYVYIIFTRILQDRIINYPKHILLFLCWFYVQLYLGVTRPLPLTSAPFFARVWIEHHPGLVGAPIWVLS